MKKLISILSILTIVLGVTLGLSGCGTSTSSSEENWIGNTYWTGDSAILVITENEFVYILGLNRVNIEGSLLSYPETSVCRGRYQRQDNVFDFYDGNLQVSSCNGVQGTYAYKCVAQEGKSSHGSCSPLDLITGGGREVFTLYGGDNICLGNESNDANDCLDGTGLWVKDPSNSARIALD